MGLTDVTQRLRRRFPSEEPEAKAPVGEEGRLTTLLAVVGFALYWPQLRSFEFTALVGTYANSSQAMVVMLAGVLIVLAALCAGAVARRCFVEQMFGMRDKRAVLLCCSATFGACAVVLAPHTGVLEGVLFLLGVCGIALGHLALTLAWASVFVAMDLSRSLSILVAAYALASFVPFSYLLPMPVGTSIVVLSPALSSLCWFVGSHEVRIGTDRSFGGVRSLPIELISMIALFLLVGRFALGTTVTVDAPIALSVRCVDFLMDIVLMLSVFAVLHRKWCNASWGLAVKVSWLVPATLFVAGMLLLISNVAHLKAIGEGIVAAGFNCFEFVLWAILVGVVAKRDLSIVIVFGCVFTACRLIPMFFGKLVVPHIMLLLGWTDADEQLVPLLLVLVLLLVAATFFFLAFNGISFETDGTSAEVSVSSPVSKDRVELYGLTPREVEVVGYVLNGFSYQKTADEMGVSLSTVQTHVKNLYRKMGIHTRDELVDAIRDRR